MKCKVTSKNRFLFVVNVLEVETLGAGRNAEIDKKNRIRCMLYKFLG